MTRTMTMLYDEYDDEGRRRINGGDGGGPYYMYIYF